MLLTYGYIQTMNFTYSENKAFRRMKEFLVLFAVILVVSSKPWKIEDLIDEINSSQDLWRAAPNHIAIKGKLEIKKLLGLKKTKEFNNYPIRTLADYNIDENKIPKAFDARKKWAHCTTISSIKDQSDCGSCWAVSSASAMSDRLCIASKHKLNVNISAENLMSCCTDYGNGCLGGSPEGAWDYFRDTGLPTGGDYGSDEGCQPYEIEPCSNDPEVPLPLCPKVAPQTPECYSNMCTNKKYKTEFNKDKHYGKTVYYINNNVKAVQADIMKHGPLVVGFDVYDDFIVYESGIYKHIYGDVLGAHAVRVLGWGTEKGTDYWLIANSWNRYWGENGLFRIVRGTNECKIESYVVGGLVKPK